MIINKDTSDALLVNGLNVFSSDGKPVKKVKQFNTDTLQYTLPNNSTDTALDFSFTVAFDNVEAVKALLPEPIHHKICPCDPDVKSSMNYDVTDSDYVLAQTATPKAVIVQCSNCQTKFLLFTDGDTVWTLAQPTQPNTMFGLTELVLDGLACENCAQNVEITLR